MLLNEALFQQFNSEYFNIRLLIRDELILLSKKFFFNWIAHMDKLKFGEKIKTYWQ